MTDPNWDDHCVKRAFAAAGVDLDWPRSWGGVAALYRRLGVRTLEQAVTHFLGEPVPARRARRGDVVLVDGALGICRGEVAECFGATVPMRRAAKAWRTG